MHWINVLNWRTILEYSKSADGFKIRLKTTYVKKTGMTAQEIFPKIADY